MCCEDIVGPVLLHGCEAWAIDENAQKRVDVLDIQCNVQLRPN